MVRKMLWFYENVLRTSLVSRYDIPIDMKSKPTCKCQKAIYLGLVFSENKPIMELSDASNFTSGMQMVELNLSLERLYLDRKFMPRVLPMPLGGETTNLLLNEERQSKQCQASCRRDLLVRFQETRWAGCCPFYFFKAIGTRSSLFVEYCVSSTPFLVFHRFLVAIHLYSNLMPFRVLERSTFSVQHSTSTL